MEQVICIGYMYVCTTDIGIELKEGLELAVGCHHNAFN